MDVEMSPEQMALQRFLLENSVEELRCVVFLCLCIHHHSGNTVNRWWSRTGQSAELVIVAVLQVCVLRRACQICAIVS